MKLLTVDTIDEARAKMLEAVKGWKLPAERVKTEEALGRFLAENLYSNCDLPAFNRATVDGYAVIAADTAGAGENIPVFLSLTGQVEMGKNPPGPIQRGQCMAIPTGAMMPDGADSVVMVEYCEAFDERSVAVYEAAAPGAGMIRKGEDLAAGSLIAGRGIRLRAQEAAALASAGITEVSVYMPLGITIISTGDELVPPDQLPKDGKIRDVNTTALLCLAKSAAKGAARGAARGATLKVVKSLVIPDNEELLGEALTSAMADSDIVAVSGGSSQGEKDATARVFARYAKPGIMTHGLSVKPGKPAITAFDAETKTLLAGLPGHPVSAMMVFELLIVWLAEKLMGQSRSFPIPARISCNIAASPGKTSCQPVTLRQDGDGYTAEPVFGKSGMTAALTKADGYIVIDINKEGLRKGETVMVYLF